MVEATIDVKLLKQWINPYYLQQHILLQLPEAFTRDGIIQLISFLREDTSSRLKQQISAAPTIIQSLPDSYVYEETDLNLFPELVTFLYSPTGKRFIEFITSIPCKKATYGIKSFGHRHYTLLHDEEKGWQGVDLVLDLTAAWHDTWGGYTRYINAQETLFTIFPKANTLTLIRRTKDMHSFVKYVNASAGKHKRIFIEGIIE